MRSNQFLQYMSESYKSLLKPTKDDAINFTIPHGNDNPNESQTARLIVPAVTNNKNCL
jgi:hypothetical protein